MEKLQFENSKDKRNFFMNQVIERTGETKYNNYGSLITIDEYRNSRDITVRFLESGYMTDTTYGTFLNGSVKSPFDRSVYGVGYLGSGKYKAYDENNAATPQYRVWTDMLRRCYSEAFQKKHPTYRGVTVCESWLNFNSFALWYDENYYEIEGQRTEIEKDLLSGDNKTYSPETCLFVPHKINMLVVKRESMRGDLPIGVIMNGKKYVSQCNKGRDKVYLGTYDTPEEAFQAYKTYKESYIKEKAEQYKDLIPVKLYNALINYKVEIDD